MNARTGFLVESLKNFKTVGAVATCSPIAVGKLAKPVDFSRARFIIELGGGTGVVTKEIVARMRPDAELVVFEVNPFFVGVLKTIGDSRVTVVHDSAENLGAYLASRKISEVDAVISTLPLANMAKKVSTKILSEVATALALQGRYIQIQYSLVSKKEIKRRFSRVSVDFTWFNLPPAFIYICTV